MALERIPPIKEFLRHESPGDMSKDEEVGPAG